MSIERNKQVVRDIFAAIASADIKRMDELMTDDATWWLLPSIQTGGAIQKKDFLAFLSKFLAGFSTPLKLKLTEMTAEDDRVSITATGHGVTRDGKVYDNHYHTLFVIRDGKVVSAREYFDTAYAKEVFGG